VLFSADVRDPLQFNLFRFANRELSHSAFWAWMFQTLDAGGIPELQGPRRVILRLLELHHLPPLMPPVEVRREVKLNAADRLDIQVSDSVGTLIVIENKLSAIPDAAQVERYRSSLGSAAKVYLIVLSTAFDEDVRASLGCDYIGGNELLDLVEHEKNSHFLLGEYCAWLREVLSRRRELSRKSVSDNPADYSEALKTAEGQWALMATLMRRMPGRQYRSVNFGGDPWTEFRFVEQAAQHDAIFYRVEIQREGPQLRINQYRDDVKGRADYAPKAQRLNLLRKWWSDIIDREGPLLRPARVREHGVMSSEIGRFLLAENSPSELIRSLPAIHREFVIKLAAEGWPVTL